MTPAEKRLSKYTDEQLNAMTYVELASIGHGTVSTELVRQRIVRGVSPRVAAATPSGSLAGKRKPKNHPYRKFRPEFYSNDNQGKAEEVRKQFEKK
ncbi:MAG: hypothetical protein PVI43_00370 [Candidatus Bathyarchaeota archaeon]|jgi:hypothetical protein